MTLPVTGGLALITSDLCIFIHFSGLPNMGKILYVPLVFNLPAPTVRLSEDDSSLLSVTLILRVQQNLWEA